MDKDFKLASQLLTLLDTEKRWFTLAEIEKKLGISDKTIRKMVEEISKQLPPSIIIEVFRGKGVLLQRDGHSTTISEVISIMFRQTTFYRLMHLLFTKEGQLTLEELADAMFMSTSSLKKLIIQLNNNDLKPYNLRISHASPTVKGNEIHIRYFYWKLYCDAYDFTGWPFARIDFTFINQLITTIESEENIIFFINSKRRLTFLVAIVLERIHSERYVNITDNHYPWERGIFYRPVSNFAKSLEKMTTVTWTKSELLFMQSMFSLSQYNYYDGTNSARSKEVELRKSKEEFLMVNQFLALLLRHYPNLDMKERFVLEVYEFFDKLLIDNAIPEWMAISKNNLTEYVQKECLQIYQEMQACMQMWTALHPSVIYNDSHLVKLTLLVSSSLRYKSKKAFLVIGEEFSIRHYVAKLIKKEIGDDLIVNTSIMKELTDDIVKQHEIDFVISNFPIALSDVPVVIISTIPTKKDLENIRKELLL
ncbi:helix-turn-helix domain-containing protein [Sporosarcina aquimarina]|uniref:helix-turn-helix domain-containing protein n=1 Tax=Sporosarcina aquimarina TaxID=114975 RepID=UPI00203D4A5E|nr:helix-turn-helix domain-containing protein [Sporosarcina aquimarina]